MRRPLRTSTVRAAVAAPVLVLALGACAADDTTPTSAEASKAPSSASPSPAAEGETEAADVAAEDVGTGGSWDSESLVPAMLAAVEEAQTTHFTMVTDAVGATMRAEGDMVWAGDKPDMAMVMDGQAMGVSRMELRMVDGVVYLSMPPMTPRGKFMAIDPEDSSSPLSGMLDGMQGLGPAQSFEAFEQGLERLEFVGEETVAGEDLEHYRLTLDLVTVLETQGLAGLADTPGLPKTVDYDLWLDDEALMRRMETDVMDTLTTMEMSQWGEPVTVRAPAPKDVVEAPQHGAGA